MQKALWGIRRPHRSADINWGHPAARGLVLAIPFNDGAGTPRVCWNGGLRETTPQGTPQWDAHIGGVSRAYTGTGQYDDIGTNSALNLPTAECTVVMIRRKQDTTLRASAAFYCRSGTTEIIGTHCPYSDGTVYWDFGENSGANRLTWAGYTATTDVEFWVFTAGSAGSAIYLNGVSRASQATGISRVNSGATFQINQATGAGIAGDLQDMIFLGIWDRVWDAGEVWAWYNRPYDLFQSTRATAFPPLGTAAGGGAQSVTLPAIASGATINAPTLAYAMSLPAISGTVLSAPSLAHQVQLPAIASGSVLNPPTLAYAVSLPSIAATALNAPALAYAVTLPTRSSAASVNAPTLAYQVQLPAISGTVLNPPSVTGGILSLNMPAIAAGLSLSPPTLAYVVTLPAIGSGAALNAPTVTSAFSVTLSTIPSAAALFAPSLSYAQSVVMPTISGTILRAPAVTGGAIPSAFIRYTGSSSLGGVTGSSSIPNP